MADPQITPFEQIEGAAPGDPPGAQSIPLEKLEENEPLARDEFIYSKPPGMTSPQEMGAVYDPGIYEHTSSPAGDQVVNPPQPAWEPERMPTVTPQQYYNRLDNNPYREQQTENSAVAPSFAMMVDARAAGQPWDDIHDAIAQRGGHDAINLAGDVQPLRPFNPIAETPGITGDVINRMREQDTTGYSGPRLPVTRPDRLLAPPANDNFQSRMSDRIRRSIG